MNSVTLQFNINSRHYKVLRREFKMTEFNESLILKSFLSISQIRINHILTKKEKKKRSFPNLQINANWLTKNLLLTYSLDIS